jgi:hypothetical protein
MNEITGERHMPRTALSRLGLPLAMLVVQVASADAAALPARIGACSVTTVKQVESRLEGMPDSGSAIAYDNGGYQVSYDMIAAIQASRGGDEVKLCLTYIPHPCPPGDIRGRVYRATNLRTGGHWSAPDAEHACGGA